eukprot:m.1418615 g.1418615  ORF g.1418615 m.1418615 type:complete len:227 (+) comp25038_c0_seq21:144-824(+)
MDWHTKLVKTGFYIHGKLLRQGGISLRQRHSRPHGGTGSVPPPTNVTVVPETGKPRFNVVFCNPQIGTNTGSIGRTCIGLGAQLHLIEPLGFSIDEKQVRRSGLDYWKHVDLQVHESWSAFCAAECVLPHKRYFFTREAEKSALNIAYPSDCAIYLLFGAETFGFTEEIVNSIGTDKFQDPVYGDERVAFPMYQQDIIRCFNLSTSASMGLWQAFYQTATNLGTGE